MILTLILATIGTKRSIMKYFIHLYGNHDKSMRHKYLYYRFNDDDPENFGWWNGVVELLRAKRRDGEIVYNSVRILPR